MEMLRMPTASRSRFAVRRKVSWLGLVLGLVLGGWGGGAQAFFSLGMIPGIYVPQWYYKHGAVYTRAIVPGPTGRPVYVEYDTSGKEAREIGEAIGQYERAQVMSGDVYRAYIQRQKDARERYPTALVMTAAEYRGKTFKTVTGETINKPSLQPSSLTVMVRPDKELFTTTGTELLLLQLPIKDGVTPDASSKSLLLSPEGAILNQTSNTIGFRVGFFGKDGKVADTMTRDRDAKIYGPMPGVGVSLGGYITGGYALTNNEGRYSMQYFLPACPGFTMEYTTPAYLELQYKRFNPRGGAYMPYYMTRMDYDFCNGLGVYSLSAAMIIATAATPIKRPMDFPVDLMVLDGTAKLKDAKVADKTAYSAETSDKARALQEKYDFDGDEKPDFVVPGKKVTKSVEGKDKVVFVTTSKDEAELQGIYLSSRYESPPANTEETAPDFTRLIDTAADFKDRGLLESITKEELKDTDIYVFRESNGQLVAERRGLHEDELYKTYSGVDEGAGSFRYTIQLRGSTENFYAIAGRTGEANFAKWQSAGGFKEEFQKRSANHLKAGEQVRIIAINRPTGYIGSARIQLQSALSGNMINLNSQQIEMAPPNLKIWAERKTKIEKGITKGEDKKQLIGNEGAGLGSDVSIAIYSDWRDADDSPLPEELADYGYTGRLAKIVATNQLAPVGANGLSQFKIKPGQQVQVIQLPEKVLAKQHLYLQVAGQPENRNPDFSSKGSGSGVLKYRPTHYVPVKVPLHDEEASELARQAYRKADKEFPDLNLKAPQPFYDWYYRPEMQFSLYELNVQQIRKVDAKGLVDQLYDDKKPVVASSDKLLELYYDMLKSEFAGLDPWSYEGEREIVLAVGQEEIKVSFGKDQTLKFDNFEHFRDLDVDDFLSIRLYANNDSGNVLLEWAFEYLSVFANEDEDFREGNKFYYLSADNPVLEFKSILAGYNGRRAEVKKPETVEWSADGSGSVSPRTATSEDSGIFTTALTLPPRAGSKSVVSAKLRGGDANAYYKEVIVVPGIPARITAGFKGALYAGKIGALDADIFVTDKQGNAVTTGTSVDFTVEGEGKVSVDGAMLNRGAASVRITGAENSGSDNYLIVTVGEAQQRFKFDVNRISVKSSDGEDVYEDQVKDIKLNFSGISDANIERSTYAVKASRGTILEQSEKLDANGDLIVRWHTGFHPGPAEIYFPDGSTKAGLKTFNVLPDPSSRIVDKRPVSLVRTAQDKLDYTRTSGQVISVPVLHEDRIKLSGRPGEKLSVELGDEAHPNQELLVELKPANLARSQFISDGVKLARSPGFISQQSSVDGRPVAYNYKGYELTLLNTERLLQLANDSGIELLVDYTGGEQGTVLSWQDLLKVEQSAEHYTLSWKTEAGTFNLAEVPLPATIQRRVKLRVEGNTFTVELNGQSVSKTLPASVVSGATGAVTALAIKKAELQHLFASSLAKVPLLAVNGSTAETTTITFDAQGRAEMQVRALETPTIVGARAIPLRIGNDLLTVSLHSPASATELLSGLLAAGDPPLDDAVAQVLALDVRDLKNYSPQANLAAQIEASGLAEAERVGALLRVLASFPEGRAIRTHIPAIEKYTRTATPRFQGYLEQILGDVIARRNNSTSKETYKRVVGLIVFAEMLPGYGDMASYLGRSLTKAEDLELWLDTMAMPANGWAFFEPPTPQLEQSCTENVVYAKVGDVDMAPYNPCRLQGENFGAWVASLTGEAIEYRLDPTTFVVFLRGVHDALPEMSFGTRASLFRTELGEDTASFDPTSFLIPKAHAILPLIAAAAIRQVARIAMQVGKKLGKNFVGNFIAFSLGKSNTRMQPFIFLLSTGYVYENICEEAGCIKAPEVRDKFWTLMRQLMVSMAFEVGKYEIDDTLRDDGEYACRLLSFAHGNMYEMFSIAYYHLMSKAGGKNIAHIDRVVKVPLYGKIGSKDEEWIRRPDIELEGNGEKTVWIELKSVQAAQSYKDDKSELPTKEEFLRKFPVMSSRVGAGSKQYHKQFVLDRIAAYGMYEGQKIEKSSGYHWRFQNWKEGYVEVKTKTGKKRLSRGYPMKTAAKGHSGTYLDMIKDQFANAPERESMYPVFGVTSKMSDAQLAIVFANPLFDDIAGDIDEYILENVVKKLLKEPAQLDDIRETIKKANSIYETYEEWADYLSVVERLIGVDLEDTIAEELVDRGKKLAESVAERAGMCTEDD